MTIKPFLSHKRENAATVGRLRDTLKLYGAGGWKDTEDLRLGDRTSQSIRSAIFTQTGGMLWWGTRAALSSWFINNIELPTAFQRKNVEPDYPIVPLFIDVDPGSDADRVAIRAALGRRGDDLLDCNGLVRRRREPAEQFRRRVARRYVRDAVNAVAANRSHGATPVTIAIRTLSEPSGDHELTFDWRTLINPSARLLAPGATELIGDALATAREALQAASSSPAVLLDLDLPLPLAFLTGYQWRTTTRLRLAVRQRTGVSFATIESDGPVTNPPQPTRKTFAAPGPAVLAISCRTGLGDAAERYAAEVGARELISLHVPGLLDDAALRGLARACADQLQQLNHHGIPKHLLVLGPSALAVFAGAAANATGPVTLPFWDGTHYVQPLWTSRGEVQYVDHAPGWATHVDGQLEDVPSSVEPRWRPR